MRSAFHVHGYRPTKHAAIGTMGEASAVSTRSLTAARPADSCMRMLRLRRCRMAPEVLIGDRSSVASDIFSYGGCMLPEPQILQLLHLPALVDTKLMQGLFSGRLSLRCRSR